MRPFLAALAFLATLVATLAASSAAAVPPVSADLAAAPPRAAAESEGAGLLQPVHRGFRCRYRRGYTVTMFHDRYGRHRCRYRRIRGAYGGGHCWRVRRRCSALYGFRSRGYFRCLNRRGC